MFLVTGANGFIGSAFVSYLNQLGIEDLIVTDTFPKNKRAQPLGSIQYTKFIQTDDLFPNPDLDSLISSLKGIFHMGACSSTTETNEGFLKKNNTEYTKKLFLLATKHNIPFIYASSAASYGDGKLGFSDQKKSTNYSALNLYGKSKLDFDVWAEQQTETPPAWFGLRFFNVYGPNEYHKGEQASVVIKAFKQISETNKLNLFRSHNVNYKDGEQLRDFVYIKDIIHWMYELYEKKDSVQNGIYNMGFGSARSWLDLAKSSFNSLSKDLQINWIDIPKNIRDHYQYYTKADMDKWFSQGLSQPKWTLEDGVNDYIINYLTGHKYL